MDTQLLIKKFHEIFPVEGQEEVRIFFSPGRINLIGEHTDYNGGHVFPGAITYGTYGAVKKRDDQVIKLYSINFPDQGSIECSLNEMDYRKEHGWANYPKGVIRYIQDKYGLLKSGLDILIQGNIPNGAGLSSSASLEMLMGIMINEMFDLNMDRIELVKLGKKVENEFIGVNSGIMDQFAVGMGKADCGILLDCNTLKFEYAPLDLDGYDIVIMNTNKRRELADSKYNERRRECEKALSRLQTALDIHELGDLSEKEFEASKHLIADETLMKRARHAVYENQRTLKALHALRRGEMKTFGKLMNDSHHSLRDDYEVTGKELDTLVEAAWKHEGVLGARMTGAGFGGCAIAIVASDRVEDFIQRVGKEYLEKIGYKADFYVAKIGDGAKEITKEVV
ncbi:galactokinase [Fictibacillus phosphorivorans]|uniref:galactokinase n=1 Tax=Fictibacillus phosphorivorans TaxID=1221500 RepID=UPI00203EE2A7|nr:galactokinase [Fictibacillus phosphorivorans]MCM3717744.1 galactokinase [Fictibacillus phosphorivorans]MCM3775644.1 galactokinase [Fictibacillus phosphorivorans]